MYYISSVGDKVIVHCTVYIGCLLLGSSLSINIISSFYRVCPLFKGCPLLVSILDQSTMCVFVLRGEFCLYVFTHLMVLANSNLYYVNDVYTGCYLIIYSMSSLELQVVVAVVS